MFIIFNQKSGIHSTLHLFQNLLTMRRFFLLALSCICLSTVQAQKDSTLTKDTIVEELKDGVLDNIPVVSLDDNDASDVSSQNVASVLTAGRDPFFAAAAFAPVDHHLLRIAAAT